MSGHGEAVSSAGGRRPSEERLQELIEELRAADDARHSEEPSTTPYHAASRMIEELAREIWWASVDDELDAQEHAEIDDTRTA